MKQTSNDYQPGVRAEPRFLRDPTSLEFISSGLTRFSSYVVSNLPKRKPSMQYSDLQPPLLFYQQQPAPPPPSPVTPISSSLEDQSTKPEPEDDHDKVTFTSFQHMETLSMDDTVSTRRLCLLLGYHDGFQIWDITNPDNIHEICSIRDEESFGTVSFMHIVNSPYQQDTQDKHPLLAVVTSRESTDNDTIGVMDLDHTRRASTSSGKSFHATSTMLRFYSLNTHQVIKEIHNMDDDEEETRITAIKSNHTAVVVGCIGSTGSTLHVLSCKTLDPLSTPITDVYHDPTNGPVFTLGARFLAYATHSPVLNDDLALSQHKGIGGTGLGVLQGDKDVKDIAKEVVSGVKSLSEYGYQTLSNYFGNHPPDKMQPPPQQQPQAPSMVSSSPRTISPIGMRYDERTASPVPSSSTHTGTQTTTTTHRKAPAAGMVMIRDIAKLPTAPTRNMSSSTVAHFRPHSHPLSCLTFNAAGTLLLSASKQGHTFHIFGVLPSSNVVGNISHLYSLARGYTDAQVEDCQFSADSMWCSVSTARGTTHVYAINPYGGKPEIMGHVVGKVNNPTVRLFMNHQRKLEKSTSLGSVVRVKQRRPMISETHDDIALNQQQQQQQHYPTATIPPPIPTRLSHSRQPRAKLSTMFLLPTKIPYLVHASKSSHGGSNNTNGTGNTNASGSNSSKALLDGATSFKTFKQQASSSLGSMLSSFGSSISSTDSSSSFSSMRQHHAWTSAHDKLADNRLFGFDEEEMPTVEDDDSRTLHDGRIGYQDMYSIHPRGMLTLHRCWVSKSVVKKRDHSRTIELVVKQEDVAEWSMARTAEWEQVKVSLAKDNNATDTTRKKKRRSPWLSNAEITTCLPDEQPLWTSSQFRLQTFSEDPATLSKKLWKTGEMPEAKAVHVRRELPEPYSSRIDRVGKTTARITSQDEENLDDALAELEDNLSKAMQTTFTTPSPTTLLSGSYGSASPAGYKRGLQQPIIPGNNGTTPSSISFEDAHLISMGSGPSPEDLLTHHQQQSRGNMALHHSSLIQFDEEEEVRLPVTPSMQSSSSIRLEDDDDDTPPIMDQQVFSPDGDNEMAHPSESIFAERSPPSL